MKNLVKIFCAVSLLTGCQVPQRAEINVHMWNQGGLPKALCDKYPEIARSGIYRRLNDELCTPQHPAPCYEFLSYCNPRVAHYLSIQDAEYNQLLDKYLGPEGQGK